MRGAGAACAGGAASVTSDVIASRSWSITLRIDHTRRVETHPGLGLGLEKKVLRTWFLRIHDDASQILGSVSMQTAGSARRKIS